MKDRADQKVYGTWGDSVRRRPVVWLLRAETSPDRVEQALTALIGITGCGLAGRPSVAVAHSFDNRHEPCHDLIGQEERADEGTDLLDTPTCHHVRYDKYHGSPAHHTSRSDPILCR